MIKNAEFSREASRYPLPPLKWCCEALRLDPAVLRDRCQSRCCAIGFLRSKINLKIVKKLAIISPLRGSRFLITSKTRIVSPLRGWCEIFLLVGNELIISPLRGWYEISVLFVNKIESIRSCRKISVLFIKEVKSIRGWCEINPFASLSNIEKLRVYENIPHLQ